jgi:hypothetical protein
MNKFKPTIALLLFWIFLIVLHLTAQITTDIEAYTTGTYTSLYSYKLLGFSPLELILFLTLFCWILGQIIRKKEILLRKSNLSSLMLLFFIIIIIGFFNGFFNGQLKLRIGLYETKLFLYIIIGYFLTTQLVKNRKEFDITFWIIFVSILISTLIGLYNFVEGRGFPYGPYLKTLLSGEANVSFIPIGCWLTWLILKAFDWKVIVLIFPFIIIPVFLMLTGIGKEMILYLLFLFAIVFWKNKIKVRLRLITFTVPLGILLILFVQKLSNQWIDAFKTLFFGTFYLKEEGSLSVITRFLELKNIWKNLVDRFAIFQGLGLGVYWKVIYPFYTEIYVFPPSDPVGFHKNAHLFLVHILLKFGLIGLGFYIYLLYSLFKKGFLLFDRLNDKYYKGVILGLLSGILPILNIMNYYKLFLFSGVFIALISILIDLKERGEII